MIDISSLFGSKTKPDYIIPVLRNNSVYCDYILYNTETQQIYHLHSMTRLYDTKGVPVFFSVRNIIGEIIETYYDNIDSVLKELGCENYYNLSYVIFGHKPDITVNPTQFYTLHDTMKRDYVNHHRAPKLKKILGNAD